MTHSTLNIRLKSTLLLVLIAFCSANTAIADDHGDTYQTATPVTGQTISGTVTSGDEDWFEVDMSIPGILAGFCLSRTNSVNVSVYNSSGEFVADDLNVNDEFDGFVENLIVDTYYIRVAPYSLASNYILELRHPAIATVLRAGETSFTMRSYDIFMFSFASPPNKPIYHCVGSLGDLTINLEPYDSLGFEGNFFEPLYPVPSNLADCDEPFFGATIEPRSGPFQSYFLVYSRNFGTSGSFGLNALEAGDLAQFGGAPTLTYKGPKSRKLRGISRHFGTARDDARVVSVTCTMKGVGTRRAKISGNSWSTRFSVKKLQRKNKRRTSVTVIARDVRGQVDVKRKIFRIR